MKTALKAELRKILSVRSTYLLFAVALLLSSFVSFWVYGYKDVEQAGLNNGVLLNSILATVSVTGLFLSFLAVLLVGHEYRYNLIMYTLTTAKSRIAVFFAKLLAVSSIALIMATVIVAIGWGLFYLGQNVHHVHTVNQYIPMLDLLWRALATILAGIIMAFLVTTLLRNLVGAIIVTLVMPTTVEPLLGLLLKDNTKYLPYTALSNLTNVGGKVGYVFSIRILIVYAVVLGAIALILFKRRDAN